MKEVPTFGFTILIGYVYWGIG